MRIFLFSNNYVLRYFVLLDPSNRNFGAGRFNFYCYGTSL
nr:MAG TPA: hypothetical protein [Caudoviricetes sp.]DAM63454.1 MAG TPA: hypothetical protein [Caudoviricetes sp.]DAP86535.1 MAG TPA: hypothetical protein [Caudoviricetes sp.]